MSFRKYLPDQLSFWIAENGKNATDITIVSGQNMFITEFGKTKQSPHLVSKAMFDNIVMRMCKGSIYANQNTLKSGYITIEGGHRVGAVGQMVSDDCKNLYMRNISAINIRISREIYGAADCIVPYVLTKSGVMNTLIISPPSSGKTTALRDLARQVGNTYRVGIVDERLEISQGKNIGKFSFVVEGASKVQGIEILQRTMSPEVIITDEIGPDDEITIERSVNAGIKIICSAHGYDETDVTRRNVIGKLMKDRVFDTIIVLSQKHGPGTLEKVIQNRR